MRRQQLREKLLLERVVAFCLGLARPDLCLMQSKELARTSGQAEEEAMPPCTAGKEKEAMPRYTAEGEAMPRYTAGEEKDVMPQYRRGEGDAAAYNHRGGGYAAAYH